MLHIHRSHFRLLGFQGRNQLAFGIANVYLAARNIKRSTIQ